MKRTFLSLVAAFAASYASAAIQVTARQLTNAVDHAIAVASNYTDSAVASAVNYQTVSNITEDVAQELIVTGDTPKLNWDDDNDCAYIVRRRIEDGKVSYITNRFTVTSNETEGNLSGVVITDGDASSTEKGDVYGYVGNGEFKSGGGTKRLFIHQKSATIGTNVLYTTYVITNLHVIAPAGSNVTTTNVVYGEGWKSSIRCREISTTYGPSHVASGTNYFTVSGFLLTPSTHRKETGLTTPPAQSHPFSALSGMTEVDTKLTFTQQGVVQAAAPRRRFSLLDLFVGSAYADGGTSQSTVLSIELLSFPKAPMVDAWNYAPEGVTKETHWCDCDVVYDRDAFNNPENWFPSLPVNVTLQVTDPPSRRHPDGYTYEVQTEWDLEQVMASGKVSVPRWPWVGPNFYEKKAQCAVGGHIFINCHCKYHPNVSREHSWTSETTDECAHCQLMNDKEEYDSKNGVYVNAGPSDVQCDYGTTAAHPCTSTDEGNHGGWSATHADENFACVCDCGFFGANHAHKYEGTEYTEWQKEDKDGNVDGEYHWAYLTCERCEDEKKWKNQKHTPEAKLPLGDSTYQSPDTHKIQGKCEVCGWEGQIVEGHRFQGGSGALQCYCTTCKQYCHKYTTTGCGSKYQNQYCSRCQEGYVPAYEQLHDFSNPRKGSGTNADKHFCVCGRMAHYHWFFNGVCEGGASVKGGTEKLDDDKGCGAESGKTGHACPLGKLNGKGDNNSSHVGRHGDDPFGGGCPCGTTINSLFSDYDSSKPATGGFSSHAAGDTGGFYAGGTGAQVVSRINTALDNLYYYATTGDYANFYFWANGRWAVWEKDYVGSGNYQSNMVYDVKIQLSGTVKYDEKNSEYYIEWR